MSFFNPKRLSCGVVILNPGRELLLCHVTGQNHWDLPKGGIDPGETPLEAAVRETREESGVKLDPDALLDLGRFHYTNGKNLHLFATCMPRFDLKDLRCETRYLDRWSGRQLPEMDGYGWFGFERIGQLCTPKMAQVLTVRIELDAVLARLRDGRGAVRLAAAGFAGRRRGGLARSAVGQDQHAAERRALDLQEAQFGADAARRREAAGPAPRREHAMARHEIGRGWGRGPGRRPAHRGRLAERGGQFAIGARLPGPMRRAIA